MRSYAISIHALAAAACLCVPPAFAEGPTAAEAVEPLVAVTKRERYVIATTDDGFFRARLDQRRWERLEVPADMPRVGAFVRMSEKSPVALFVARGPSVEQQTRPGVRAGLYASPDDGLTWERVSDRGDISYSVLVPESGLFVLANNGGLFANQILGSTDLGRSWRDITGNPRRGVQFVSIEPNSEHPGRLRVHGHTLRAFTIEADGEDYEWRWVRERRLGSFWPSTDFFARSASSKTNSYPYVATLSNYFGHDFGNSTYEGGLELVVLGDRFEFARGDRMPIPVKIVLNYDPAYAAAEHRKFAAQGQVLPTPAPPLARLVDQSEGVVHWWLRVGTPDGRQFEGFASWNGEGRPIRVVRADGEEHETPRPAPRSVLRVVEVSPGSPYRREVDLSRIAQLSLPGEYRIQLIYTSASGEEHPPVEDTWGGHFTSPVFTVVVRD